MTASATPLKTALREWGTAAAVSLLTALAVVSPFFVLGIASGHDIAFHMASWLDAAGQWKQGVILPRWTEWANFGYGEPRFIFYPPLSWLFGALLGNVMPWESVATAFTICVQCLAGLTAYAFLRRLCDGRWAALLGAACFAANPYALVIVYTRSDFAELLAMAVFPLLFLVALRICGFLPLEESGGWPAIPAFGLAFCAIWLANAPAAVIATYSVTLLVVLAAICRRSVQPLLRGALGLLLGFGLAGFYLVPAIYEQRWVNISGALAGGLTPAENFLYATTTDAEHDAFNRVASNIAVMLIAWAILAGFARWRLTSTSEEQESRRSALFAITVLGAVAALLMLPVTAFVWNFLPELRFVQFPWRWMSVVALCAVAFIAASARGRLRWVWPLAIALSTISAGRYLVKHTWWDTEDMPTLEAAMHDGSGFEGTDEYDPLGDDRSELPQKAPRARFMAERGSGTANHEERIFVDEWSAEHRRLRVSAPQAGVVAVRLLNYPAWRVTVNGRPAELHHPNETAEMRVPVPPGESRVDIAFIRTADRKLGGWISVLSAFGMAGVWAWPRRRAAETS